MNMFHNLFSFGVLVLIFIWKSETRPTVHICRNCRLESEDICETAIEGITLDNCTGKLDESLDGVSVKGVSYRDYELLQVCSIYTCESSFDPFDDTAHGTLAFLWSYGEVCTNFTVDYTVNAAVNLPDPDMILSLPTLSLCQELCYERHISCSVDYNSDDKECRLFTQCGACAATKSNGNDVTFSRECHDNANATNATTIGAQQTTPGPDAQTTTGAAASPTISTTTASTADNSTISSKHTPRIYIVPCHCSVNRTFINLTNEEIEERLILATRINARTTTKALDKLRSKYDDRFSAKAIGTVGILVIVIAWCLLLSCDISLYFQHE